ncbi:MAG: hypothetical protein EBQ97_03570 [Bacteroidetes bacterium]|nr:hypothetical protein [Bacteroidota bacterium]
MEANKTPLLEVLNNLASIHHEVRNDQTQLLDIEKLGKLKLLAAQLYMEVDIELLSMEFPELQEADSEKDSELISDASSDIIVEPTSDLVIDLFVPEVEIANIELPFAEIATKVIEEVQVVVPDPIPAPIIEPVNKGASVHTVVGIIGQFPLSRRFEFSNILFGGDMDNMGLFVQEIIDAPSAAVRGDVYDRWYEQKQWRRRDESASDMWRMIKRIFTQ